MALEISDLSTLDSTSVAKNYDLVAERLQELYPDLDIKRSPYSDLVLQPGSILMTANEAQVDLYRRSSSLAEINVDTKLADTTLVDNVLSNYRITRKKASSAVGSVTIVLSAQTPTTIAKGATFKSNGLTFTADAAYNARITEASVAGTNDKLLVQVNNGWAFTIGVIASATGIASRLKKDTALVPDAPPAGFVTAYAENDFTGGTDVETNADLIKRLEAGGAVRAVSNRITNLGLITAQSAFSNILAISEVGYEDEDQLRYHSIFPIAFGGRVDMYVRTQELPQLKTLTKTATLVAKNGTVGTWQFSISADDTPGFYRVKKITQTTNTGSYLPTIDTRGFNTSATTTKIDITSALEATYSRYSTTNIQFDDTDTNASALTISVSTRSYKVYIEVMPLISELQTYVKGRDVGLSAGDILVKAPVPCFMSVSFNINKYSTDPTPDTNSIKTLVASAVNKSGFPGAFSASVISKTVHAALTGTNMTISNIAMLGQIRRPDGTIALLSSDQILTVPSEPTKMVSSRTVGFILDPADIAITIVSASS